MQTTTYKLNVTPGGVPLTIHISQYDVGLRQYIFQPYTSEGEFTYVSGATVTLEATKPDGYAVIHNCTYNQDGSITYTVQAQLAAVPGRVWSKVVIRNGNNILGTGAVVWMVDNAGVKDNAIVSDSDISALQQWMANVEDYSEAAASSASLAESAVTSAQAAATQAAGYVDQAVILGGTPLVAATVSAMTNHDRVYVYTGSETGYTAGNWYYWNGSAWTSGGIYNSSAVQTDPTLSVSGMAADAAATGELKNGYVSDDLAFLVTVEGKYVDGTGEKTSGVLAHTDYIPVPDWATQIIATSKSYNAAGTNSYKIAPTVVWYDSTKTFIETGNTYVVKDTQNFPVPDGAKYCIVNQPRYETQNKRFIQFTSAPIVARVGAGLDKTVLSHTSFTNMLSLLKNVSKPKTIYVNGGTYDIFAEYATMGLTGQVPQDYQDTANYMPYNVIVPPNTHIIGLGNVTLSYMPTTSQTYVAESQIISPLNVSGSATIENIKIVCKNGRYCIHDEGLGLPQYVGAIKKYKNVKCYKYINDTGYGFNGCIGFGLDARMIIEFDGCELEHESPSSPTFYMHNRATYNSGTAEVGAANSGTVIVKNSIIEGGARTGVAFSLGNVGVTEAQNIKFNVENCYIRGWLRSADNSSTSTGNNGNAYNITLLNCSNTQVLIRDANNPYPVRQLNPIGDVLT